MQKYSAVKCLCAVTCIMIVVATVTSAAPSYADYDKDNSDSDVAMSCTPLELNSVRNSALAEDTENKEVHEEGNMRDMWEMFLQKEALEDKLGVHQQVRKSSRTPSLRLRFGRRSDPSMPAEAAFMMAQAADHEN